MIPAERRRQLLEVIKTKGTAKISELSKMFHVSEMTIHRDLSYLEENGLVEKTYGGVISSLSEIETDYDFRRKTNASGKLAIGYTAAALVKDGDTILLDSSTTALAITPELENRKELTIFCTGVVTATALTKLTESNHIYCTGGQISPRTMSYIGPSTVDFLKRIHVDKCFIGAGGVHPVHGVTDPLLQEVDVKRHIAAASKEVILVVDRTKFGRLARFSVFPLSELDLIITDADKADPCVVEVSHMGVEILFAG
jgi:DeoR/GlpR family transcriptional regulator of sugar metabolism